MKVKHTILLFALCTFLGACAQSTNTKNNTPVGHLRFKTAEEKYLDGTQEKETNELSMVASVLFADVCFSRFFKPKDRIEYLNTNRKFKRRNKKAVNAFLKDLGLKKGQAWDVYGDFDIVVDNNNQCVVYGYNTNPDIIHSALKNLSAVASREGNIDFGYKEFHKYTYTYSKPVTKEDSTYSAFYVLDNHKRLMRVLAKTRENVTKITTKKHPDAIITLKTFN